MNKTTNQQGYVLVLTVMMLSIGILMISQFVQQGMVHVHFDRIIIDREQARSMALNGIQLAMSQLSVLDTTTTTTDNNKSTQDFLEKVFPALNRWQEITFNGAKDGVDGTIKFCISSEDGKIDINQVFDFQKKKFKNEDAGQGDMKKIMKEFFLSMKKFSNDKDLFDTFEKFLKQRHYKFNDATELLTNAEFQTVFRSNIFYEPPSSEQDVKERPVFLTDIFTVFSQKSTIQPWLLSDSIQRILSLKTAYGSDEKQRKDQIKQLLKEKPLKKMEDGDIKKIQELWDTYWQKIYGKDFKSLPQEIVNLFTLKFEPMVFSVVSYGIVGQITQKALAIIERFKSSENNTFLIKKLYWL